MEKINEKSVKAPSLAERGLAIVKKAAAPAVYAAVGFAVSLFSGAVPTGIAVAAGMPMTAKASAFFIGAAAGYILAGAPETAVAAAVLLLLRAVVKKKGREAGKLYTSAAVFCFLFAAKTAAEAGEGITVTGLLLTAASAALAAAMTAVGAFAFDENAKKETRAAAVAVTVSALAASLFGFEFGWFSLGYAASVFIVLTAARSGGVTAATVYGTALGAVGAAVSGSLTPLAALSTSGLAAGLLSASGKLLPALASVAAAGLFALFGGDPVAALTGASAAGAAFIILPEKALRAVGTAIYAEGIKRSGAEAAAVFTARERLKGLSKGITEAADIMESGDRAKDIAAATVAVEKLACDGCGKKYACYGRLYDETADEVGAAVREAFYGEKSEKSERLRMRCERAERLFGALTEMAEKREKRSAEGKRFAAEAVKETERMIASVKDDEALEGYLRSKGEKCPSVATVSENGIKKTVLSGYSASLPEGKRLENELSEACGAKMRVVSRVEGDGYRITAVRAPRLSAFFAGAVKGKDGNALCGDSIVHFSTPEGRYYAAISDGMGSGAAAKADSSMTVNLLKCLLTKNFDGKTAMRAVNSAMRSSGPDASFATVDMLALNLHNGAAEFIKAGAAPSFVRRGDAVFEITSSTLPAGLSSGGEYDRTRFTLKKGDVVVMMSDGVYEGTESVKDEILRMKRLPPAEMCRRLVEAGGDDDRSAAVIVIGAA